MAEGFELYHVPQQTRRDKLRVTDPPPPNSGCVGLLPSYEPPLHHELLTCAGHGFPLLSSSEPNIKGENANFMGFQPNNTQTPTDTPPSTALIDGSLSSLNPNDTPFVLQLYRPDPVLSRQQGLSLSLSSTSHPPMEVNFQFPAPPGPFTGYTSILKGSIFMRPAQQLLQEICELGGCCSGEKMEPDPSLLDPPTDESYSGLDHSDDGSTMPRLISMLDEVYRRYRQYCQHLQAVVASFESIPGLNNAAPFASFALKSLSKHFKSLKTAITDQLQFMRKASGSSVGRKHGQPDENDNFTLYSQRPIHNSARIVDNPPVWRPQRGLPERAVSVLRSWLFEHFLHPYPTDTDKMMLAKQTGLSRNQVSNWFINARVRLWKPMVEEIHSLETRQQAPQMRAAASSSGLRQPASGSEDHQAPNHARANPSSSSNNPPEKRVRNELMDLPMAVHHQDHELQLNLQYGHQFGVGGSNGVSLTLALHQNSHHGMNGLLDPYPTLALAHRYELSGHDDGGFGARGVMGGQLSHDFMG